MSYVDGYLLPVPKKNIAAYKKLAMLGAKVWKDHGAIDYRECVGDDLFPKCGVGFSKQLKVKPGETVVFSWIVFKSKAHRDKVNKAVMKDTRIAGMNMKKMPFDVKRMCYGGFKTIAGM